MRRTLRPSAPNCVATTDVNIPPTNPHVRGKFLYAGDEKLYLRGVTYGTFGPGPEGDQYPAPDVVERDFARMAWAGLNAVRTYTVPPAWLLDLAHANGLWAMVGVPWEAHIAFLDDRATARRIERKVASDIATVAGHPAILSYAIGNEIPSPIARWHGRRRTESFIERLHCAAKDADPDRLVTYVNYPTTEYLQLPFVDFVSFNVYLEQRDDLEAYLARLHNLAGDRPLVMAEIGLDSRRNGEDAQATTLEWQLGAAFGGGCAGAFVFAWTDEWHRGGYDIDDWDFGIVDRARRPKPALEAVARSFERLHQETPAPRPRISVVVCSHNGEHWLPGCLDAARRLDYPDWELLVVSDGSTDRTEEIARSHGARVVATESNLGLSAARNIGMNAATGEIVAYLDDDARPDPDWLSYLALSFARGNHAAVGGPNLPPGEDGDIADCVAHAPGGPVHVLLTDEVAEHIPGCNMAVRRDALQAVGGFDPRFRIAGDDVDLCWRLQDAGHTIGFSPAAMVWHHRRNSIRAYLRQQHNYGRAEALLEQKWPHRYNRFGHLSWGGRIYGAGAGMASAGRRARVAYGKWGGALFQSIYQPAPTFWSSLAMMPEWYVGVAALLFVSLLGLAWAPLLVALPLLGLCTGAMVARAWTASARPQDRRYRALPLLGRVKLRSVTMALHLAQPAVRLAGRFEAGLHPWRRRSGRRSAWPRPRSTTIWSERWRSPDDWLRDVEAKITAEACAPTHGSQWSRWDLETRGGGFGVARLLCVAEEHGGGRQLVRMRTWPVPSRGGVVLLALLIACSALAAFDGALAVTFVLAACTALVAITAAYDCALATGTLDAAVSALDAEVQAENQAPHGEGQESMRAALAAQIADSAERGEDPIFIGKNGKNGGDRSRSRRGAAPASSPPA